MDNEKYYAWYDTDGDWIGSAVVVSDYTTLPNTVRDAINAKYPEYTISSAHKELHRDRIAYEVVLKDGDTKQVTLIDLNGVVLKSKMKS